MIFFKDQRVAALMNTSVKNRVASALLSLCGKYGASTVEGFKLDVPISRKSLAMLSGTVPETLARTLTEMEEDKIIRRKKRSLYITDLNKLKNL